MKQPRTAVQAAASRLNGARSRGPLSAATQAGSAHNALKHGLFRSRALLAPEPTGSLAVVASDLRQRAATGYEALRLDTALVAAARLEEATALADTLREQILERLAAGAPSDGAIGELIAALRRITRYQRRFRGQRDRALRKIGTPPPEEFRAHPAD